MAAHYIITAWLHTAHSTRHTADLPRYTTHARHCRHSLFTTHTIHSKCYIYNLLYTTHTTIHTPNAICYNTHIKTHPLHSKHYKQLTLHNSHYTAYRIQSATWRMHTSPRYTPPCTVNSMRNITCTVQYTVHTSYSTCTLHDPQCPLQHTLHTCLPDSKQHQLRLSVVSLSGLIYQQTRRRDRDQDDKLKFLLLLQPMHSAEPAR